MSKTLYVFSTLSAPVEYTGWSQGALGDGNLPRSERAIRIEGGAHVSDKFLRTPRGVVTPIDAEDLQFLEENIQFRMHRENGFIQVESSNADANIVAEGMNPNDKSSPLTPEDFNKLDEEETRELPEVGMPTTKAEGKAIYTKPKPAAKPGRRK